MSSERPKKPGPPHPCDRCGRRKVRHKVATQQLCHRCGGPARPRQWWNGALETWERAL